jgi:hypothetical protein
MIGGYKYRHRLMGFMKYVVEVSSCAMIYIPSYVQIGSGIQMLMEWIHRQQGDPISLLLLKKKGKGTERKASAYSRTCMTNTRIMKRT